MSYGPQNWKTCMSGKWQAPHRFDGLDWDDDWDDWIDRDELYNWWYGRKVLRLHCDNTPIIDRLQITGDFNRSDHMYLNESIISIAKVGAYKAGIYFQHALPFPTMAPLFFLKIIFCKHFLL